uniref:Beta-2 adrenergic receptor n=1 Tax=Lygus hesperus TaxID=30085 RepID=A0A0A9XA60_LYGHE
MLQNLQPGPDIFSQSWNESLEALWECVTTSKNTLMHLCVRSRIRAKLVCGYSSVLSAIAKLTQTVETYSQTFNDDRAEAERIVYNMRLNHQNTLQSQRDVLYSLQMQEILLQQHEQNLLLQLHQVRGQLRQIRTDIRDLVHSVHQSVQPASSHLILQLQGRIDHATALVSASDASNNRLTIAASTLKRFQNGMHR